MKQAPGVAQSTVEWVERDSARGPFLGGRARKALRRDDDCSSPWASNERLFGEMRERERES